MRKVGRGTCSSHRRYSWHKYIGAAILLVMLETWTAVAHRDGGMSALGTGCQIVDWKDADMGSGCEPQWVVSLFGHGDERQCRRDFSVDRGDMLVCGSAYGASCEAAFAAARTDAVSSFTGGNSAATVNGLVPLCDFWQEVCNADTVNATRYRAFVVYTYGAKAYGGHHNERQHRVDAHHWGY